MAASFWARVLDVSTEDNFNPITGLKDAPNVSLRHALELWADGDAALEGAPGDNAATLSREHSLAAHRVDLDMYVECALLAADIILARPVGAGPCRLEAGHRHLLEAAAGRRRFEVGGVYAS